MRESLEPADINDSSADAGKARKRPKPGERRLQILQVLAEMLQNPKGERVTTAALAAKISLHYWNRLLVSGLLVSRFLVAAITYYWGILPQPVT